MLWYFTILIYMCIPVLTFAYTQRNKKTPTWRQVGYARLVDVLFFQRPITTEPVEAMPPSDADRRINRLTNLLVLDIAVLLLVIVFLGDSLRPCAWLDLFTGYSGCLYTWPVTDGGVYEVTFSGEGTVVAASGLDGPLKLYQTADGALTRQIPEGGYPCGLGASFSPDGQRVATLSDKVTIRDVNTGNLIHSWHVPDAHGLAFSPDGTRLAVSTPKSGIQLWRTADWTLEKTLRGSSEPMAISADGRLLAAQGLTRTVTVWNIAENFVQQTLLTEGWRGLALSPDGRYIAIAGYGDPVTIWNVETSSLSQTIPVYATSNLAYSPDGKFLVVGTYSQMILAYSYTATVWHIADNRQVMSFPESSDVDCVAFSPVENKFAYGAWEVLKLVQIPDRLQ